MRDTYTEIFFHLVWATKGREPMITLSVETTLHRYIQAVCGDLGIKIYALGGMPDHVHLACSLPTTQTVAGLVQKIKGGSAHLVNHSPDYLSALRWQPGYGALTLTSRDLPRIVAYIENQETHHQEQTLLSKLERCSDSPAGASRS